MLDKNTLTIIVKFVVFRKHYYIISGVKKFEHITPVLRAIEWLLKRQQLYHRNAVTAFNCVTGCAPDGLTDQFIKDSEVLTRTTRNSQKLQTTRTTRNSQKL